MPEFQEENLTSEVYTPSLYAREISEGLTRLETQMTLVLDAIGQIKDHDIRLTKLETRLDSIERLGRDFHNFKEESRDERRRVTDFLENFQTDWKVSTQVQLNRIQNLEEDMVTFTEESKEKKVIMTTLDSRIGKMERWKSIIIGGAIVVMFFLGRASESYIDNLINPQNISITTTTPQTVVQPQPPIPSLKK